MFSYGSRVECSVSIQDVLNCSVKGLPPFFLCLLLFYTIEETNQQKKLLALFMANISIHRNDSCLRLQIVLKCSTRG